MKIWILNQNCYDPSLAAGSRHFWMARELEQRGHKVTIIAGSFLHNSHDQLLPTGAGHFLDKVVEGVRFIRLRTPPYRGNGLRRILNQLAYAWHVFRHHGWLADETPDVILASWPPPFGAFAGLLLARRLGVPFVFEVRDLWPDSLLDLGTISRRHPLMVMWDHMARHICRRADGLVTLLSGGERWLRAKGAPEGRTTWVSNGIDVATVPEVVPPTPGRPFTLMYAGNFGYANCLEIVIEAARRLETDYPGRTVLFRLVGRGQLKEELEKLVARLGLNSVSIEPARPKSEIHALLLEADAFLSVDRDVAIHRYGIAMNKLFDYMACGRPTINGTNAEDSPIALTDSGLLVPPENVDALVNAILTLMDMPADQRHAMGLRGRAGVAARYDVRVLAERLETALLNAVECQSKVNGS